MNPPTQSSQPGYETSDARVGWVLASIGLLVLGIGLSFVTAAVLYRRAEPTGMARRPDRLFQHGAGAVSDITRDWQVQEEAVRQHLDRYAWVDRDAGEVQIPIERAMELMVQPPEPRPENSR